jgi:hypothetical protein
MSIVDPAIVTELLTLYDVTTDSETKALLVDLIERTAELDRSSEPGFVKPTEALTRAHFDYFIDVASLARNVSERLGIDVDASTIIGGETVLVNDFSVLSYDDFIDEKTILETALAISIPDIKAAFPAITIAFQADVSRTVISKLLVALGVKEAHQAFLECLEELLPTELEDLAKAIKARQWRRVGRLVKKVLTTITSKAFFNKFASKVGEVAARKIIGKIAAKFIPVVGWGILIASLIWAFGEEIW